MLRCPVSVFFVDICTAAVSEDKMLQSLNPPRKSASISSPANKPLTPISDERHHSEAPGSKCKSEVKTKG